MQRNIVVIALVLALLVVPASVAVTVAVTPVVAPSFAFLHSGPRHNVVSSSNWAGFAVTGPAKSVTFVKGSWIEPKAVSCRSGAAQYSSFWVGIDGYSSTTVEQTGTDTDCQNGSAVYYAWYEFFPAYPVNITTVPIHPGDTVVASVTWLNASFGFKISLTDSTTGLSFTNHSKVAGAQRSSAEWIAEAPTGSSGVLPLADFGTVHFGKDATGVSGSDIAIISGTNGAIGSFAAASVHRINMINLAGTKTKAATSVLTPDGTSFNVTWKHYGP